MKISLQTIKRFLREDRLEIVEKNNRFLKCEVCGAPICSGQYCGDCLTQARQNNTKVIYIGAQSKLVTEINFKYGSSKSRRCAAQ